MTINLSSSPFDVFQWLPDEICAEFSHLARLRHYAPGELIYCQGESGARMYRLVSGAVRLSVIRADGKELLYVMFEPGDCFGVSSLIDGESLPHTAAAVGDTEIQTIGRSGFERLRAEHREFDDALLRLVSRHMRLLSGFLADAHLEDMTARVASRIVATARSFGQPTESGISLSIALSQAELALMVGGTRQTVNKVIQQFQHGGLVSMKGGRLTVHSIEGLLRIASEG